MNRKLRQTVVTGVAVGALALTACVLSALGYVAMQYWPAPPAVARAEPTAPPTATVSPPTPTPTATPPGRPAVLGELHATDLFSTTRRPLPPALDPTLLRVLVVTGDIIPARYTNYKLTLRNDFTYPFKATLDQLKDGDLRFANLEAPLMKNCPVQTSGMQFCGNARFVEGLKYANINLVNLANNHSGNYGYDGVDETIALLKDANIGVTGWGEIYYTNVRGMKFAFLGYNGVGIRLDREKIKRQVAEAHKNADVVVVQFHWGKEYVSVPAIEPGVADDDPREFGRLAIDAGADLIIGNHPHWVQGVEVYKGKLITYAHGNFIFDQNFSRETREGVIGRYVFYGSWLADVSYTPVLIDDYTQPRVLTGEAALAVLNRMKAASQEMIDKPYHTP